ncbi:MAG: Lacal_2735 family protein [Salibacteraceae bacterium]
MFGLFKKPTETERLQKQYRKLIEEAHRLSTIDRKASDLKMAEADEVMNRIESLSK